MVFKLYHEMKKIIKDKYQYFLLLIPFSLVFVGAAAMVNYMVGKKRSRIYQLVILIPLYSFVLAGLIPLYIQELFKNDFQNTIWIWVYYYVFFTPMSIWIIRNQGV